MRLWSLHPRYLDRQGLAACWREGLLAQAVLGRPGAGYGRHPQLERFRAHPDPSDALSFYLSAIADEADARGYSFARAKITAYPGTAQHIPVTRGQLEYEWRHLRAKLERRSPAAAARWAELLEPEPHPLFIAVDGQIATWERPAAALAPRRA